MYRTHVGELIRVVEPPDRCVLTVTEVAALAGLHAVYPHGLPDDVQTLFVRAAVVQRILYTPMGRRSR